MCYICTIVCSVFNYKARIVILEYHSAIFTSLKWHRICAITWLYVAIEFFLYRACCYFVDILLFISVLLYFLSYVIVYEFYIDFFVTQSAWFLLDSTRSFKVVCWTHSLEYRCNFLWITFQQVMYINLLHSPPLNI